MKTGKAIIQAIIALLLIIFFFPVGSIAASYAISGYVRDSNNNGISDATLTFTDNNSSTNTTTDSSGYYVKILDSDWSGTVSPSKKGYSFTPQDRPYSNLVADQIDQDYIGNIYYYTISGYIRDSNNNGIPDVILTFSNNGGTATTDSSGYYVKKVIFGWSGSGSPSKIGYSFTEDRSYIKITENQSDQDYIGTIIIYYYIISGYVRDSNNKGISDVTLTFSDNSGTAFTDDSGYYKKLLKFGWSGNASPSKKGYSFTQDRSYINLTADQTDQNYTGTVTTTVMPGDVNENGKVDLEDAILALRVVAGINPAVSIALADVNNDGNICLEEVIYVLQTVAGLRP